jgi:aryl-alcohol dehydrogenase-like predicted oxidoreductase
MKLCLSEMARAFLNGVTTNSYSTHDILVLQWRSTWSIFSQNVAVRPARKVLTPSRLPLAWLLAQGDDSIPIPGTKRRERLEENLRALEIELSEDDLRRIDEAAPPMLRRRNALS